MPKGNRGGHRPSQNRQGGGGGRGRNKNSGGGDRDSNRRSNGRSNSRGGNNNNSNNNNSRGRNNARGGIQSRGGSQNFSGYNNNKGNSPKPYNRNGSNDRGRSRSRGGRTDRGNSTSRGSGNSSRGSSSVRGGGSTSRWPGRVAERSKPNLVQAKVAARIGRPARKKRGSGPGHRARAVRQGRADPTKRTGPRPTKNDRPKPRKPQSFENPVARYRYISDYRWWERGEDIEHGRMSDPEVRTTLRDAITVVGNCQDMCPEFERVSRIVERDIWKEEGDSSVKDPGTRFSRTADERKMVKKFARSAAGAMEQQPSDLRPPVVLAKTLDYLFHEVLANAPSLASVHLFLWDRTRAIRNDFSIQQVTKLADVKIAVSCLERIARFHILSLHLLGTPKPPYDSYAAPHEREQLNNTLMSLFNYYDDNADVFQSPNEAEFRAYQIVFSIQGKRQDLAQCLRDWGPRISNDPSVQAAVKLHEAALTTVELQGPLRPRKRLRVTEGNWFRFWELVDSAEVTYLLGCMAEVYIPIVRFRAMHGLWKSCRSNRKGRRHESWAFPISDMRVALCFDTDAEAEAYVRKTGFGVKVDDNGVLSMNINSAGPKGFYFPEMPSKVHDCVERKRLDRPLAPILDNISASEYEAKHGGNNMFVPETAPSAAREAKPLSALDAEIAANDRDAREWQKANPEIYAEGLKYARKAREAQEAAEAEANAKPSGNFGTLSQTQAKPAAQSVDKGKRPAVPFQISKSRIAYDALAEASRDLQLAIDREASQAKQRLDRLQMKDARLAVQKARAAEKAATERWEAACKEEKEERGKSSREETRLKEQHARERAAAEAEQRRAEAEQRRVEDEQRRVEEEQRRIEAVRAEQVRAEQERAERARAEQARIEHEAAVRAQQEAEQAALRAQQEAEQASRIAAEHEQLRQATLNELAFTSVVQEGSGFLDQFLAYLLEPEIEKARVAYENREANGRLAFLKDMTLMRKFARKWRSGFWKRKITQEGKNRRKRLRDAVRQRVEYAEREEAAAAAATTAAAVNGFQNSTQSERLASYNNGMPTNRGNEANLSASMPPPPRPVTNGAQATSSRRTSVRGVKRAAATQEDGDSLLEEMAPPTKQRPHPNQDTTNSDYIRLLGKGIKPPDDLISRAKEAWEEKSQIGGFHSKRSHDKFAGDTEIPTGSSSPAQLLQQERPTKRHAHDMEVENNLTSSTSSTGSSVSRSPSVAELQKRVDEAIAAMKETSQWMATERMEYESQRSSNLSAFGDYIKDLKEHVAGDKRRHSVLSHTRESTMSQSAQRSLSRKPSTPPKYRSRPSKFLPRDQYADVPIYRQQHGHDPAFARESQTPELAPRKYQRLDANGGRKPSPPRAGSISEDIPRVTVSRPPTVTFATSGGSPVLTKAVEPKDGSVLPATGESIIDGSRQPMPHESHKLAEQVEPKNKPLLPTAKELTSAHSFRPVAPAEPKTSPASQAAGEATDERFPKDAAAATDNISMLDHNSKATSLVESKSKPAAPSVNKSTNRFALLANEVEDEDEDEDDDEEQSQDQDEFEGGQSPRANTEDVNDFDEEEDDDETEEDTEDDGDEEVDEQPADWSGKGGTSVEDAIEL